ncbi:MAG: hypothetical protein ACM3UZ_11885 [Acidobacteriota bacterium]
MMSRSFVNLRITALLTLLIFMAFLPNGCTPTADTKKQTQNHDQKNQAAKTEGAFSLPDLYSGKMVNFPGDFAGKRTVVVFFSTS